MKVTTKDAGEDIPDQGQTLATHANIFLSLSWKVISPPVETSFLWSG